MNQPLVAIIGAGASHVSGDYAVSRRPPLTRDLFRTEPAVELLRTYALAQAAGQAIERDMRSDNTLQFEAALKRLQDDGFAHHRQKVMAVAPFLQALLIQYSAQLGPYSDRYADLVDELLKLPVPTNFVSLNYDTLLDRHLDALSPLDSADSYIDTPLGWTLIKPHGSIAWYVQQPDRFDPARPPGDSAFVRVPISLVPLRGLTLERVRRPTYALNEHGDTDRYPAIALPDGPKDELILPSEHRRALHRVLKSSEMQLLVLGYSALDTEILNLIRSANTTIRRLTVVNRSGKDALDVFSRIVAAGIEPIWPDVFDGSLEDWIDGEGLKTWVSQYEGPFAVTHPDDLEQRIKEREAQLARISRPPPGTA
jgi:hypothetical protein